MSCQRGKKKSYNSLWILENICCVQIHWLLNARVKQGNEFLTLKKSQHAQKCGGLGLQTGNTGYTLGATLPLPKDI